MVLVSPSIPKRLLFCISAFPPENQPAGVSIVRNPVNSSSLTFPDRTVSEWVAFGKQNLKDVGLHNDTENKLKSENAYHSCGGFTQSYQVKIT